MLGISASLKTQAWVLRHMRRSNPGLTAAIGATLVLTGAARALQLWSIQRTLDVLWHGGADRGRIHLHLGVLAGALALEHACVGAQSLLRTQLNYRTSAHHREQLLSLVGRLPFEVHDSSEFHDALSRAQDACAGFTQYIDHGAGSVQQLSVFIASMAYAASIHWSLPLAFVLGLMPALIQQIAFGTHYTALVSKQTPEHRKMAYLGQLLSDRASSNEVWLFGLRRHLLDRWRELSARLLREKLASVRRHQTFVFFLNFGALAGAAWGLWMTIRATLAGAASFGGLVTGMEFLFRSGSQGQQFTMSVGRVNRSLQELDHLRAFFARWEARAKKAEEAPARAPAPVREITLEDLSFCYPGMSKPALRDINCTLVAGERVAIVGENGSGKSTLAAILLGFYEPSSGRILIDGKDRREIPIDAYRLQCSAILQDFQRYELSLRDNLLLDDQTDLEEATRQQSGLGKLLDTMPRGLATPLGRLWGGKELSVGQWQTIAIARALCRRSSLLVMDEPTAALDPRAEVDVYARMLSAKSDGILVMISHRMGMCRLVDRVLVLSDGQLVESGSHEQLMQTESHYHEMFASQAQWYDA